MIYVKILEWLIEILLMLSGFVGTGQFHCQFEPGGGRDFGDPPAGTCRVSSSRGLQ